MAKTNFKSVDEYITAQAKDVQVVLRQVRNIIRKAVPGATEVISYQLPTYKIAEGSFLSVGGWKDHYSLYGATRVLVKAFKGALAPYDTGKGTVRFPLSEPVPAKLIERIAKYRAREVVARKRRAE